jgi:hypothetical protein
MPPTIDPFAETQPAWWWRRLFDDKGTKYAPKRYAKAAAFVGSITVAAIPHSHHFATYVVVALLLFAPASLVETWYKQRQRRRDEQLFTLPTQQAPPARGRVVRSAIRATAPSREAGPKAGP